MNSTGHGALGSPVKRIVRDYSQQKMKHVQSMATLQINSSYITRWNGKWAKPICKAEYFIKLNIRVSSHSTCNTTEMQADADIRTFTASAFLITPSWKQSNRLLIINNYMEIGAVLKNEKKWAMSQTGLKTRIQKFQSMYYMIPHMSKSDRNKFIYNYTSSTVLAIDWELL